MSLQRTIKRNITRMPWNKDKWKEIRTIGKQILKEKELKKNGRNN